MEKKCNIMGNFTGNDFQTYSLASMSPNDIIHHLNSHRDLPFHFHHTLSPTVSYRSSPLGHCVHFAHDDFPIVSESWLNKACS